MESGRRSRRVGRLGVRVGRRTERLGEDLIGVGRRGRGSLVAGWGGGC